MWPLGVPAPSLRAFMTSIMRFAYEWHDHSQNCRFGAKETLGNGEEHIRRVIPE
jgi:hypothetical protein